MLTLVPAPKAQSSAPRSQPDLLKEMSACLERERTAVADGVTRVKKALDSRHWLTEGRGPYEWDDDNWHKEFAAAAHEILEALEPLEKIARDFQFCPTTHEEVQAARVGESPRSQPDLPICPVCQLPISYATQATASSKDGEFHLQCIPTSDSPRSQPDEQLVIDLARELYDRFLMGGWEPQDAHGLIREMLGEAPRSAAPTRELIDAAEQLLAWQPQCSLGSSGDLRQKRVRAALDNLGGDGSLKSVVGVKADLKHPGNDTGGETAEIKSEQPRSAAPTVEERVMYEDDLPSDMPKEDYDVWYAQSYIPGGVGVRVGPVYPTEQPRSTALILSAVQFWPKWIGKHGTVGCKSEEGWFRFAEAYAEYRANSVPEQPRSVAPTDICPICGHEWSRHDPEDGRCDAGPPCGCGRNLEGMQTRIAALSKAALSGMQANKPEPVGVLRIQDTAEKAKEVGEQPRSAAGASVDRLIREYFPELWQDAETNSPLGLASVRETAKTKLRIFAAALAAAQQKESNEKV